MRSSTSLIPRLDFFSQGTRKNTSNNIQSQENANKTKNQSLFQERVFEELLTTTANSFKYLENPYTRDLLVYIYLGFLITRTKTNYLQHEYKATITM